MATSADISSTDKKHLTALYTVERLGGTLEDAIISQRATMNPEDVDIVERELGIGKYATQ